MLRWSKRREPNNTEAEHVVRTGERGPAARWPRRSLLGEVLDWMLAPLFLLWPMSVAITYVVAQNIADVPYDQALARNLHVLEQQLVLENGTGVSLAMSAAAREVLRVDDTESIFWLALGGDGEYLGGDRQLPVPDAQAPSPPGIVRFADASLRGFGLRLAYTRVAMGPSQRPAVLVVAETVERRTELANDIIKGVIMPQFAVLPIAVLLVWFGLSRGIAPLNALQRRLRARRPDDLSPMDEHAAPSEVAPLVVAMNELLRRQSRTLETQRQFVADAAHQLKTPLAGLRTQAELALRNATPEDMQTSLRHLVAGSERAARLVNQLLLLAHAESPAAIGLRKVDLRAVAHDQAIHWTTHAIALGTDLGFEADDAPIIIDGQPLLLGELLNNLIDNALRYTPPGGRVTVRVASEGDRGAVLEVEDSGPGIPESERERVFDRFYRVLGNTPDGSGLGLAIVKEIADKHAAQVSILDTQTAPTHEQPDDDHPSHQIDPQAVTGADSRHGTRIRVRFAGCTLAPHTRIDRSQDIP